MKRLLLLLFVMMTVLASIPAVAEAVPYNASTRGFGLRAGDLEAYTLNEWYAATQPTNDSFVRADFDLCHGQNFDYGPYINAFVSGGAHILPIISWSDNGCYDGSTPHVIDNQTERDQFKAWAKKIAQTITGFEAYYGLPQTNLYEIWNEPNGNTGGNYTRANYHNNVYLPARAGIREADGDAGTLWGALCFGTSGNCAQDAGTWVDGAYSSGYTGINGFSIHPYGGSNFSGSTAALQTAGICQRVGNDARSVWVTETGKPATEHNATEEEAQRAFLDILDNVSGPRTFINWIGQNQSASGGGSKGLMRLDGSGRPSWTYWYSQTFVYSGDTNTHC